TASKYKQEKSLLFFIKIIFSSIRDTFGIIGASAGGPTRHLLPNEVESGSDRGMTRSIEDYGQAAARS
ncbi:MAG: hypothetical protein Q7T27_21585, partial [Pseudomonas sp.]|uniref:hypothetical protein n=1 Tax=Pseudomonas sp. TaxID=306 RepID=UPI0027241DA4